jgi:hypothetical protein
VWLPAWSLRAHRFRSTRRLGTLPRVHPSASSACRSRRRLGQISDHDSRTPHSPKENVPCGKRVACFADGAILDGEASH